MHIVRIAETPAQKGDYNACRPSPDLLWQNSDMAKEGCVSLRHHTHGRVSTRMADSVHAWPSQHTHGQVPARVRQQGGGGDVPGNVVNLEFPRAQLRST